ncbi:hypothetical protein SARC_05963 [Sphaeroforma arctica JP610]|uniref:Uncharacterized protein n=1 Tax=Sphaeroforma arctica JP610 TaxID=667725 RepID=A0A0L0FY26_9EUKA|nr:hypothetical protein SARC_05963 [Sphaeroforma arctica JP610]KNC81722.1 hypothetical protein SARC_05963 [Sphaeroforma arctica JP610]|eukprot:XP_014155624.1 hypothetical protein SARC_05963 [Sphaeroforma arctica JP610]
MSVVLIADDTPTHSHSLNPAEEISRAAPSWDSLERCSAQTSCIGMDSTESPIAFANRLSNPVATSNPIINRRIAYRHFLGEESTRRACGNKDPNSIRAPKWTTRLESRCHFQYTYEPTVEYQTAEVRRYSTSTSDNFKAEPKPPFQNVTESEIPTHHSEARSPNGFRSRARKVLSFLRKSSTL